jgi:uncharacterized membrane protein
VTLDRFWAAGGEWLIFWLALLAIALCVANYVIGKVRGKSLQQEPGASELLIKFRHLHSRGELSDAEYRTIKTTLAAQIQQELKDNAETG